MTTTPRIAVVVPCFNDGAFVEDAVASVREPEPTEVVVVDDGSTAAATKEVLARLEARGVRVVRQANAGLAAARMAGVAATAARYVFPLDADDQLEPGALGVLADVLDEDPTVAFAYGHIVFTGDRVGGRKAQPWDPFTLLYANRWGAQCLYRREALLAVGGWSFPDIYEDWDLLLALAEHGYRGRPVDQLVLHYRRHSSPRLSTRGYRRYGQLYRRLRERHRPLFEARAALARASGTPRWRRVAYPLLLGSRRFAPYWLFFGVEVLRDRLARTRRALRRRRPDDGVAAATVAVAAAPPDEVARVLSSPGRR